MGRARRGRSELRGVAALVPLAAMAATTLRAGRRRAALNEAVHELRRPLQALALAAPQAAGTSAGIGESLELARAALERLDRQINGQLAPTTTTELAARPLVEAAVARWRILAGRAGGTLALRWGAGDAVLRGDAAALARALDNLIVNALEHGGRRVAVEARRVAGRLRISVRDPGENPRPSARRRPAERLVRLAGRNRRGHGLRVVRRVAAQHAGDFRLLGSPAGTEARLELPLAAGEAP